jgi:hypothetical protein
VLTALYVLVLFPLAFITSALLYIECALESGRAERASEY